MAHTNLRHSVYKLIDSPLTYPVQHTALGDRRFPVETVVMTDSLFLTSFSEIEQLGKEIVSESVSYLRAAVNDADFLI